MITYVNNVSGYSKHIAIYNDSMFWEGIRTEYNAVKETKICKLTVHKDGTSTNITKEPRILYNNTLMAIKEIWVGNNMVYGSTYEYGAYPVVASYMFYYNGSWRYSHVRETVSDAKTSLGYSGGNILYGVYIKRVAGGPIPELYINGTKATITAESGTVVYVYNGYVVAIYNEGGSTVTRLNYSSAVGGSWGNIAYSNPNRIVNIPPYSLVFFNLATIFGYTGGSSTSGTGTGTGSATGSRSNSGSSSSAITATGKIIAGVVHSNSGSVFSSNYVSIDLNFVGITSNYHAAL